MSVSIGNGFEMHCGLHAGRFERSYGAQTLEERRNHGLRFAPPVANFKRRYAAGRKMSGASTVRILHISMVFGAWERAGLRPRR
jgi:hypothetical protein